MKTAWTKGLKGEQLSEMKVVFLQNNILRTRTLELLNEKLENSRKQRVLSDSYESPNWAYKQADASGYERALLEIMSLFTV
jgi:23S rRNA U2552 (ribose-2'-O)-methylase RlmE/FtsJ